MSNVAANAFVNTTSLNHNTSNSDTRMDTLMSDVRQFGRDDAAGGDAMPKLGLRVVQAAYDGVIDTTKDSDGRDDAARIYEEYVKAKSKKAIHNHTDGGLKANVSKLRKLVELGGSPKVDGVNVMERAYTLRGEMVAAEEKVKSAYAAYVDVARRQLEADDDLTDEEIKAAMRKGEGSEKTVLGELKRAAKILDALVTGEGKNGLKDQEEDTIAALEHVNTRITMLEYSIKREKLLADANEMGLTIAA